MSAGHPAHDHGGFSESGIRDGLHTALFGNRDFYFFDEIGSTNDHAAMLAAQGSPEGTVVIADRQTRGRGQKGRTWFSPPGAGIYISLVLRPALQPGQAPKITLLAAVSVAEAIIASTGLEARIKWPNDVLVGGKKIAGILCRMDAVADTVNHVIVGVGINVNTRREILPRDIGGIATSVLIETGRETSRAAVTRALLGHFEGHYTASLRDGFDAVLARWEELSCITGRPVRVEGAEGPLSGTVVGIDGDGALVLLDRDGAIHRISSGEIVPS